METPPSLPSSPPKSGLAITSLILGILSVTCLWFIAAVPAVICGHIARAKIRKSPVPMGGAGLALAGLIMGYISIALLPILLALALPAVTGALEMARATKMLSDGRQISLAIEAANRDHATNDRMGYPADAGLGTAEQLAQMLVNGNYLTSADLEELSFEEFEFGNVSASDPADTILIRSKPNASHRHAIVILKSGDGHVLRAKKAGTLGSPPPRAPAFLQ